MRIFNNSLQQDYFPEAWKRNFVAPLYKNGSRNYIENYRGIAKLTVPPAFFELLIAKIPSPVIRSVFSCCQYGCSNGHYIDHAW